MPLHSWSIPSSSWKGFRQKPRAFVNQYNNYTECFTILATIYTHITPGDAASPHVGSNCLFIIPNTCNNQILVHVLVSNKTDFQ